MIEVGLLGAGDPCLSESWTRDQRVRAMAWWYARQAGVDWSLAPVSRVDLMRWLNALTEAFPGLRNFLASGLVALGKRRGVGG